ncbi:hypothetical protein BZA05DRAFT_113288 [Tricharina praecox]|uniref:uncharacterized protein n=1 Tax=Tricharina praecox TaxID=43433 RepID=UPI0022210A18|nr:uncharacterized protein BZA05DRAFT_113288 [Tricharina praecox]KAI5858036.1 hypothetical protein BZA05DRAFT_113288 [Tricharina praecox]
MEPSRSILLLYSIPPWLCRCRRGEPGGVGYCWWEHSMEDPQMSTKQTPLQPTLPYPTYPTHPYPTQPTLYFHFLVQPLVICYIRATEQHSIYLTTLPLHPYVCAPARGWRNYTAVIQRRTVKVE